MGRKNKKKRNQQRQQQNNTSRNNPDKYLYEVKKPSDVTSTVLARAFSLDRGPCQPNKNHKKNCATNPHCILNLGQEVYTGSLSNGKDKPEYGKGDIRSLDETSFVGLKNLGATCYMNSLLQCLFMMEPFRRGIYEWQPSEGEVAEDSVLYHLQLLFTHLQLGVIDVHEPLAFVQLLKISPSVQQDAQEFYNLLLSLVEELLKRQGDDRVKDLIANTFTGLLANRTRCRTCKTVSMRPETFFQLTLNLVGNPTLDDCLRAYLVEEPLTGGNQYRCDSCDSLQDADRGIVLKQLPPILNITLMRFVYDLKTYQRKKVHFVINYPFVLNMGDYMERAEGDFAPNEETVYMLTAVVVHIGSSAHGGHYVAHIRDADDLWWKFNDSKVTPLTGLVGYEKGIKLTKNGQAKLQNIPEGTTSSPNAYMLIYTRRDHMGRDYPDPPQPTGEIVNDINNAILGVITDYESGIEARKEQLTQIRELYKVVTENIYQPYDENGGANGYWVSAAWLRSWIRDPLHPTPIDNADLTCEHGNVAPQAVPLMKRVSRETWMQLVQQCGGGPELPVARSCSKCVFQMCADKQGEREYVANRKNVERQLDRPPPLEGNYASREWMLAWKKSVSPAHLRPCINENMICPHGNMAVNAKLRRLIPTDIWNYFVNLVGGPKAAGPTFTETDAPCLECDEQIKTAKEAAANARAQRSREKSSFGSVWNVANAAQAPRFPPGKGSGRYAIFPADWLKSWRSYLLSATVDAPGPVNNEFLLCEHGGLVYSPVDKGDHDDELYRVIDVDCASQLLGFHGGGPLITVSTEFKARGEADLDPAVCTECFATRMEVEKQQRLVYEDAKIYVKTTKLITYTRAQRRRNKRKKNKNRYDVLGDGAALTSTKEVDQIRHLTVSCNMTVDTLKLHVFQAFELLPIQQELRYGGVLLEDDNATLADYEIYPGVTLILKEVEGVELTSEQKNQIKALKGHHEEGFEGSALYGFSAPAGGSGDGDGGNGDGGTIVECLVCGAINHIDDDDDDDDDNDEDGEDGKDGKDKVAAATDGAGVADGADNNTAGDGDDDGEAASADKGKGKAAREDGDGSGGSDGESGGESDSEDDDSDDSDSESGDDDGDNYCSECSARLVVGGWLCRPCKYVNDEGAKACSKCESERVFTPRAGAGPSGSFTPKGSALAAGASGDFADAAAAGGSGDAGGSGGDNNGTAPPPAPGMWACKKCTYNENKDPALACFICQHPK